MSKKVEGTDIPLSCVTPGQVVEPRHHGRPRFDAATAFILGTADHELELELAALFKFSALVFGSKHLNE